MKNYKSTYTDQLRFLDLGYFSPAARKHFRRRDSSRIGRCKNVRFARKRIASGGHGITICWLVFARTTPDNVPVGKPDPAGVFCDTMGFHSLSIIASGMTTSQNSAFVRLVTPITTSFPEMLFVFVTKPMSIGTSTGRSWF